MALLRRSRDRGDQTALAPAIVERVAHAHLELIPTPKAHLQFEHLPAHSTVSVTASPNRDVDATLEMSAQLIDLGHTVIPHLAARMVEGPEHVARIAAWLEQHHVEQAFVIGGDADQRGPYSDAASLMRALLDASAPLTRIGFGAYPDGHAAIPAAAIEAALFEKQSLLADAGIDGWVSTQMCFDPATITTWLRAQRAKGFELPVHLGLPGVIDTTKLLTMGLRLGVGASLRYLRKNRQVVGALAGPGGYEPLQLLRPLADELQPLDITALHVFTFNQVASTVEWQQRIANDRIAPSQGATHGLSV